MVAITSSTVALHADHQRRFRDQVGGPGPKDNAQNLAVFLSAQHLDLAARRRFQSGFWRCHQGEQPHLIVHLLRLQLFLRKARARKLRRGVHAGGIGAAVAEPDAPWHAPAALRPWRWPHGPASPDPGSRQRHRHPAGSLRVIIHRDAAPVILHALGVQAQVCRVRPAPTATSTLSARRPRSSRFITLTALLPPFSQHQAPWHPWRMTMPSFSRSCAGPSRLLIHQGRISRSSQ